MTQPVRAVEHELSDEEKIKAAALDYMEGYYTADGARMERALHPELAKRAYLPGADGKPQFFPMSAMTLVQRTRSGSGTKEPGRRAEIVILDKFEGAASVRANMARWVDYLHLAKVGHEWKIVNVLWELTPEEWAARGGKER
jgi:hypothetical protein